MIKAPGPCNCAEFCGCVLCGNPVLGNIWLMETEKPFLGEENRENISNILQLLQIPLAKPVFHDHPS
jgi:hypothetical protein